MPTEVAPELEDNHTDAVESAPNHEVPAGTVPKSTQQHGDVGVDVGNNLQALFRTIACHKAQGESQSDDEEGGPDASGKDEGDERNEDNPKVSAEGGVAITAQRNVEVGLQPLAQRDVPTLPEVAGVGGFVGRVEVLRQIESHEHGHTDGDVGVSGEVGIHLQRVSEKSHEVFKTGEKQGIVKYAVDEVHGNVVAENNLLCQTVQNPEDSDAKLSASQEIGLVELRNELAGTHNGTCHQLREEADVETEVQQISHRFYLAFVHIDGVADHLEGEERNAYGKHNLVHAELLSAGERVANPCKGIEHVQLTTENVIHHVGEEVGVLEVAQQKQIDGNAGDEPCFPLQPVGTNVDAACYQEVGASDEHQDKHEETARLIVEEKAHEAQEGVAKQSAAVHKAENGKHQGKESPEVELREKQR